MCEGFVSVLCKRKREKYEEEEWEENEGERENMYADTRRYIDDEPATDPVKDSYGEREERDNARRRLVVGVVWMQ